MFVCVFLVCMCACVRCLVDRAWFGWRESESEEQIATYIDTHICRAFKYVQIPVEHVCSVISRILSIYENQSNVQYRTMYILFPRVCVCLCL